MSADRTATSSTVYKAQQDPVQRPKSAPVGFSMVDRPLRGFSASYLDDEGRQGALDIASPADSSSLARLLRIDESRLPCRRRIEADRESVARSVVVELDLVIRYRIVKKRFNLRFYRVRASIKPRTVVDFLAFAYSSSVYRYKTALSESAFIARCRVGLTSISSLVKDLVCVCPQRYSRS